MSLKDYAVNRDKFEANERGPFSFPCEACKHWTKEQNVEPCRTCDHNCNAVKDDQHADTDPHEKDESRAGIPPFERDHDRKGARP
jgi:hypothetical protein